MLKVALGCVLVLLQLADYWTTSTLLRRGGEELNPVLNWLFRRFAAKRVLIVYKSGIAVAAAWLAYAGFVWLLAVLVVLYAWVVWHNVQQIPSRQE